MASAFAARLAHRALLRVSGAEAEKFLQGLITNDMRLLKQQPLLYAAALNAHGRVLEDLFVYNDTASGGYLLECDIQQRGALERRLKLQRLRTKVEITPHDGRVWCLGNYAGNPAQLSAVAQAGGPDSRFRGEISPSVHSLHRVIADSIDTSLPIMSEAEYAAFRLQTGIGEGPVDIPPGEALPLEHNLDLLGGVSWTKGCFVGQELTARTHHVGTVRKRLLPVEIQDWAGETVAPGTSLEASETSTTQRTGIFRSQAGAHGLAIVPLSASQVQVKSVDGKLLTLAVRQPAWLQLALAASKPGHARTES
eukprot:m.28941 g.28941  ORF g.28941 m.28941 type:complete len:309 (-) comp4613_c0_seq1:70-996(-)